MFSKIFDIYLPTLLFIIIGLFSIYYGVTTKRIDPQIDLCQLRGQLDYFYYVHRKGLSKDVVYKLKEYENEFNDFFTTEGEIKEYFKVKPLYLKFYISKTDTICLNTKAKIKIYGLIVNNSEISSAEMSVAQDDLILFFMIPFGIGVIISSYFVYKKCRNDYYLYKNVNSNSRENIKREPKIKLPKREKQNDKIIIINNCTFESIEHTIQDFTDCYIDNKIRPISKLHKSINNIYVLTFPFDIDFEIFCYLINALFCYQNSEKHDDDILAWTTLKKSDQWITKNLYNKKIMIFVDNNDIKDDNISFVTETGNTYKIGFSEDDGLLYVKSKLKVYKKHNIFYTDLNRYYSIIIK